MAKDSIQIWKFTPSQTLLLQEQARIHQNEFAPFRAYQARSQNELMLSFREELGIPEGVLLSVDLDTMQFTERQPTDEEARLLGATPVPVPEDDSDEPAA